ncbi:MAG TPA: sulfur carrier protein ThiS [Candidatus Acidoferrales bacterium]|nr:sulfur carrier protein ThiS [Candidatus Acidoferrales bacterium]
MRATINGTPRELADGVTLGELLAELGVPRVGVAVAVNETVVRGGSFDGVRLSDGDSVEIIRAVAGG